jgi:NAD(P)-dependent dehydrogenase (short-subunit alcohol dehydrogenase family)
MVEETIAAFGRIDILHNNVGVGGGFGTPDTMTEEAWDREIAVTLKSAFLGIKHAVPHMKAQGEGVIINISSVAAVRFLRKPLVGYTAAKAAVEALTRSCALAYGPDNIRVNCVRIGFSETPILTLGLQKRGLSPEAIEEEMNKSRRKVPLRHEHTQPWDVANASAFLASEAARGITGVIMNVDGGVELAPI